MKRVDGVVLAAGPSRRFRETTRVAEEDLPAVKQLLRIRGESLVRRASQAALDSRLERVIVVVGCEAAAVRLEIADLPVTVVENPCFEDGQSTSVRAALDHLDSETEATLFIPCDQPFLGADILNLVCATWEHNGSDIVVPVFEGRRGSPVLFARALFDALRAIGGDAGGRQLFSTHAGSIAEARLADERALLDIDTLDDYRAFLEP